MGHDPPLDPRFLLGVELFNRREFFQCHEVLEDLWKEEKEPERQLTQGIIQIAVGYYHSLKGNLPGARKLLERGLARLKPFASECRKLQLTDFVSEVERDLSAISTEPSLEELLLPKIKGRALD
jgi:uncharacterized protein